LHLGPKDFDPPNKKWDKKEQRVQIEAQAITKSKQSCTQRSSKKIAGHGRRVFFIPNPPVLQMSPTMKALRTDGGSSI